jgi:hypothetical protein
MTEQRGLIEHFLGTDDAQDVDAVVRFLEAHHIDENEYLNVVDELNRRAGLADHVDEWVALMTIESDSGTGPRRYEVGGIYSHAPLCSWTRAARPLNPDDRIVSCPQCGLRFTAVKGQPAASLRDQHIKGEESVLPVCGPIPRPALRLVKR